jgi:tetratricopeptide (TPR) repeat protein
MYTVSMSYIHDALKKAQREKSRVVARCSSFWAQQGSRPHRRRFPLATVLVACVAVGFSAYSWISSIDTLSGQRQGGDGRIYKAISTPSPGSAASPTQARPERHQAKLNPIQPREDNRKKTPAMPPAPSAEKNAQALAGPIQPTAKPAPEPVPEPAPELNEPVGVLYDRALVFQKEGNFADAKRLYEAILKKSPRMISALNNLGAIYLKEGNPSRARVFFEKAIRIDPTFVDPFYNLACLHSTQKDVKRSLFYLKKAVSLDNEARQWAKADKDLENLRGHREYEQIIKGA